MRADWRDDIGTFRVGIVAEPGAGNTVPGLALLTDAYTKALGMKVEFVVSRDYGALIEAQANAHIKYAVYSATASERCECVEPLVAPCRFRRRDRHPIRLADAGRQGPRSGRDGGTSGRHGASGQCRRFSFAACRAGRRRHDRQGCAISDARQFGCGG
ncbi:hypothetical protein [Mesorhizobium sp.]|uniref:hypothetical protein n=1 Tax=Mesorhizobium sp. TaxID=1871066 RepID=UPI00338EF6FA